MCTSVLNGTGSWITLQLPASSDAMPTNGNLKRKDVPASPITISDSDESGFPSAKRHKESKTPQKSQGKSDGAATGGRSKPCEMSSTIIVILDSDDVDASASQRMWKISRKRKKKQKKRFTPVAIDDDIEIVGIREADILSHMRSDCPVQKFERVDTLKEGPHKQNGYKCEKCFCYICDKPATKCDRWKNPIVPHCNAHPRATCWKEARKRRRFVKSVPSDRVRHSSIPVKHSGEELPPLPPIHCSRNSSDPVYQTIHKGNVLEDRAFTTLGNGYIATVPTTRQGHR